MPHVLLVVDGFPKVLGGGERIVLRLAEQLPRYGFRASILTFRLHPGGEFDPASSPCPLYLLPLTSTYGPKAVQGAFALSQFLRNENIRIVETFFESSDIWAGLVARCFSDAKLVWSRRDMGILRGAKHHLAYRAMRSVPDAVIAVSQKVADHVIDHDGVASHKVHVVHNGLDVPTLSDRLPNEQIRAQRRAITTIGNVRRVKGHDLLVEAARLLSADHPSTRFTVAGETLEPSFSVELRSRIDADGLSSRFHLLGKVNDLRRLLLDSDIFVLPSRSEGFSNALIEAMALGLPVVATDVGGNSEAVKDRVNGLLVPPEDPGALASAINTLLLDPVLADRLGNEARSTVQAQFTTEAMMRRVTGVFHSVLSPTAQVLS